MDFYERKQQASVAIAEMIRDQYSEIEIVNKIEHMYGFSEKWTTSRIDKMDAAAEAENKRLTRVMKEEKQADHYQDAMSERVTQEEAEKEADDALCNLRV